MSTYRFKNSVEMKEARTNLVDLLGYMEFEFVHWCGSGRVLVGWAPSADQLIVPWTLEVPVEMVQLSSDRKVINPKIFEFVVEGFCVPATGALLCRTQDCCGHFGHWWIDMACHDLNYIAHMLAEEEFDDGYFVDNPRPVYAALKEINEASREWLEKREASEVIVVEADSDNHDLVTTLNLI